MMCNYGMIVGQVILLNGLIFVIGLCCIIMAVILFVMTLLGAAQKKRVGTIKEIKASMVSKTAVLQVTDEEGIREVEVELRSKSKVGDSIRMIVEKRTGKWVEFNSKRLIVVGIGFLVTGLLIILPGILMNR